MLHITDDLIFATPTRTLMALVKSSIHDVFPMNDNGPIKFFLNINFSRNRQRRTITMHLTQKILSLLKDHSTLEITPRSVPANPDFKLSKDQCPTDPAEICYLAQKPYKEIVGRILYICITCRPDLAYAISSVGRYAHNPGMSHWNAVLHLLGYLKSTSDYILTLGGFLETSNMVSAYSDSDWGGNIDTRLSRTGGTIFLGKSLVIWISKLQLANALSTMEAEYMAVARVAQDVIWLRTMLSELGFTQNNPSTIFEDNKSCIIVSSTHKQHIGLKHVDIKYHFIKDRVRNVKDIILHPIPSGSMIADTMTKPLPLQPFSRHRHACGLSQE
jgi:hypothetical protein